MVFGSGKDLDDLDGWIQGLWWERVPRNEPLDKKGWRRPSLVVSMQDASPMPEIAADGWLNLFEAPTYSRVPREYDYHFRVILQAYA